MSYFRQHDLESQLSRGELHERFAGNIEKCFPSDHFLFKGRFRQHGRGSLQRYVRMEAGFGRDKKLIFVVGECGESCSQYGDEN